MGALKLVSDRSYSHKNPRVRRISANQWQIERMDKFRSAVRFSAAAKSARTALGVTQKQVDDYYGLCYGTTSRWESGMYFGWNKKELVEYTRVCARLA